MIVPVAPGGPTDLLARHGYTPVASTPAELAAQIKADLAKWSKVIKGADITAD